LPAPTERWRRRGGRRVVAGVVGVLVAVGAAGAALVLLRPLPSPGARLQLARPGDVHIHDPVVVAFGSDVDAGQLRVSISPALPITVQRGASRLVVTPRDRWEPARRYELRVGSIERADHLSGTSSWEGSFTAQPRLTPQFTVDGQPLATGAQLGAGSRLTVQFPAAMRPETKLTLNGAPLPAGAVSWTADHRSATISTDGLLPGWAVTLGVAPSALTTSGDPLTDGQSVRLAVVPTEPSGPSSGVAAGFKPATPIMVVVENSGPARPQSGLQQADMVYEYVSEYSITRMTALYFKNIPPTIGPVRSCRLINTFLTYAYDGDTMCSGVSVGTHVWMFGDAPDARKVPAVINDVDTGHHFYRSAGQVAPHNLYLRGPDAARVRTEMPQPAADFAVTPPHPDAAVGDPAPAPSVPLHAVRYTYDAASGQYLRFDHGTPFIDAGTGAQLHVKTVVLMHVPFHDAGYTEDENGGAHSIWYSMLGSGPAEVYADGRLVHATWHMGAPGQYYYWQNRSPVWFTDPSGKVLTLDTGLTWIHVLGNGQTS
jgi:hypothetical protein